jgi:hypothetical protein
MLYVNFLILSVLQLLTQGYGASSLLYGFSIECDSLLIGALLGRSHQEVVVAAEAAWLGEGIVPWRFLGNVTKLICVFIFKIKQCRCLEIN